MRKRLLLMLSFVLILNLIGCSAKDEWIEANILSDKDNTNNKIPIDDNEKQNTEKLFGKIKWAKKEIKPITDKEYDFNLSISSSKNKNELETNQQYAIWFNRNVLSNEILNAEIIKVSIINNANPKKEIANPDENYGLLNQKEAQSLYNILEKTSK